MSLLNCSLVKMRSLFRNRKLSSKEILEFFLNRIKTLNPKLNAVLTVNHLALKQAEYIDSHFNSYKDLALGGIPILLKDNFCTQGLKTTAGSKILENFIPPYSAEVVSRLEKAGAIILGKCNQDEFAMGNSNETSAFGPVANPWNKEYVPGGSSGGSASAVAGALGPASMGTDTGGSVRQPAAFCGLVGVKPTYGRVSRYGIIAYASSLDQAGTITQNVEDSATLLEVISGKDEKDSTSSRSVVPNWLENLGKNNTQKPKLAWLNKAYIDKTCSQEVLDVLAEMEKQMSRRWGVLESADFSLFSLAMPIYYLISCSEASSNLARYDGIRYGYSAFLKGKSPADLEEFYSHNRGEGFGSEVKRRIIMGTYCLSQGYYDEYYNKASQIRRLLRKELIKLLSQYDALLAPVCGTPAFKKREKKIGSIESYKVDSFTVLANLAGLPSLSIPIGYSGSQLPIGVQILTRHFDEQKLLDIAYLIQEELKVERKSIDV